MSEYSEVAAAQLDELEADADDALWEAIMDALELALRFPDQAQKHSSSVTTDSGDVVFHLPVVGFAPMKVFWSRRADGSRVEAVFPYTRDA